MTWQPSGDGQSRFGSGFGRCAGVAGREVWVSWVVVSPGPVPVRRGAR